MIYNDRIEEDFLNVLRYINDFTKDLGILDVSISIDACYQVLVDMRKDFPHVDGIDKSSTFKKVANFVTFFIAHSPIKTAFPNSSVGYLSEYNPNAIVAFDIAINCLNNSKIYRDDIETLIVEKPIELSDHSYFDILDALSKKEECGSVSPCRHQPLLSLLFEQLVYKTNSRCEYSGVEYQHYYSKSLYESWICDDCGHENDPMQVSCSNIKCKKM